MKGPSRELSAMIDAARRAGAGLMRRYRRRSELVVELKGRADFVSEADREAERTIVTRLSKAFPGHGFVTEESPPRASNADRRFIIDPLDGTTNYLQGIPHFAVAIGLQAGGLMQAGVVFDPAKDELFVAERGRGAYLGKARLQVAPDRSFARALVATGIPHSSAPPERRARYLPMLEAAMVEVAGVRRMGAAALDLSYVAAGRFAVYFEIGLKIWDMAAASLLVEEAGGRVTGLLGEKNFLDSDEVLATNGLLHARSVALLRQRAERVGATSRSRRRRRPK